VQTSAAIVVQPGSLDKAKAVFQKQVSMSEEDKKRSQVRGSRMAARPGGMDHTLGMDGWERPLLATVLLPAVSPRSSHNRQISLLALSP